MSILCLGPHHPSPIYSLSRSTHLYLPHEARQLFETAANDSVVPLRLDTHARITCGDAQARLKWWKRRACYPCGEDERRSGQRALSALRTCISRGSQHCTDVVDSLATCPLPNPDQSVLPSFIAYEGRRIPEHHLPSHKVVRAVQERLAGVMD